jgi:hypothetical protein
LIIAPHISEKGHQEAKQEVAKPKMEQVSVSAGTE